MTDSSKITGSEQGGVISGADAFKLCDFARIAPSRLYYCTVSALLLYRLGFERARHSIYRYDSLGFPADLTCLVAKQSGWGVDMKGFDAAMQQQRERARLHWTGSGDAQLPADVRLVTA
jgi:hypothetical protein